MKPATATKYPVQDIDAVTAAFPANVSHLMPKYSDIPKEFRNGDTPWNRLVSTWFFSGLASLHMVPRDGIDQAKAMRHLGAIMWSFEPKHEHKEAAVAFLLSQWFEDGATYAPAKKQG